MQRVMIFATAPWISSGYASAARYVSLLLKERGYEVAFHGWNSIQGRTEWMGMPVFGMGYTLTGWDVLPGHVQFFEADTLLVIADPWINRPHHELWKQGHDARVVFWYPCQSDPPGQTLLDSLKVADDLLCYSQWGNDVVTAAGETRTKYVPLGVATHVYQPLDKTEQKAWLSKRVGADLTGRFVVGMVAANSSTLPLMRKAFDQNMRAFRRFLDAVDATAALYLHTEPSGMGSGIDLPALAAACGLEVGKHVFFPNPYFYRTGCLDDVWMAKMYNACDVMTQATMGEGFGLPILEAQACHVPVVVSDWSSMPELTAYGYVAPTVAQVWVPEPMFGFVGMPSEDGILTGLRAAYEGEQSDVWLGTPAEGRAHAEAYDWQRVVDDHLLPALGEIYEREPAPA